MKKILSFFCVMCLAACSSDIAQDSLTLDTPKEVLSLTERVQKTIVSEQEIFLSALPDKISSMKAQGALAYYEKNQRGAGFSRTYEDAENQLSLTVFVYNGFDFGIADVLNETTDAVMEEALGKFKIYQETGLYQNVKPAPVAQKEMIVRGKKHAFLRTTVSFTLKGKRKISYIALIPSRKLMSYVRIQLTYPNSFAATKLQNAALRAVMGAAAELPEETETSFGL